MAAGGTAAIVPVLQTTFSNPTPSEGSRFGTGFAVLGTDSIVIGAPGNSAGSPQGGAAYLFNLNGAFLATLNGDADLNFGWSVTTLPGNDYDIYIGAEHGDPNTGLGANGCLYWCETNFLPGFMRFFNTNANDYNDRFSAAVAALGNDQLIVGAPASDLGSGSGSDWGAVFVYGLSDPNNFIPLTTIGNPSPVLRGSFGSSVAALNDRQILVGAPGNSGRGKAYLLSTNGVLLNTFTNPSTALSFGFSLVPLGDDRIIISAPAGPSGRVFLFNTNGTLLMTYSNPVPPNMGSDLFGFSVKGVGKDRVLIGASKGRTNTGAAFLFSTNGTLLATLTNPTGVTNDSFGISVAAVGNDRVLIGDTSGPDGGAAYLFGLVPALDIQPTPTNKLTISWPLFAPDFLLQQNTNGLATGDWSDLTDPIQDDGTNKYIIVDPATGSRFYRLIKP
jgi:hypothetical protein